MEANGFVKDEVVELVVLELCQHTRVSSRERQFRKRRYAKNEFYF